MCAGMRRKLGMAEAPRRRGVNAATRDLPG